MKTNDFIIVRFCFSSAPFAGSLFRNRPENHTLKWFYCTEDCYGYPQKPIEWNGLKIEFIGAVIVDGEAFLQEYNIDLGNQFFRIPCQKSTHCFIYLCDVGVGFPIVDILSF